MRLIVILCSLFSYGASASSFDSLRSEQRPEGLFVIHEVEEEETLFSIAKRYNSSVATIIRYNDLQDNRIDIGQVLSVLVASDQEPPQIEAIPGKTHLVVKGETLYSISKQYDIKLKDLRKLNKLSANEISIGQLLRVSNDAHDQTDEIGKEETVEPVEEVSEGATVNEEPEGDHLDDAFERYLVQTGETLSTIAKEIGVTVSAIKEWNDLESDFLRIGQELKILKDRALATIVDTDSTTAESQTRLDDYGFRKVYKEGIASVIEDISTKKYLALHRSLPIGTELEVRNLMNNLVVHVKVIGKLPDTGINKGIMLRLSQSAYDRLGILDPKSRVEISYFNE